MVIDFARSPFARIKYALLSGAIAVAGPAMAQTAVTTQPASADSRAAEGTGIEEIVVTAQKREQNLQDVPVSITALSQNAIAVNRIQDVRDLNAIAPSLTVRLSAGGSQLPNFTLRGLLTGGSAAGSDKGVALYIDGVYLQAVSGSVFDFADIERIEVLRGPQGTLFGRNSTGGAISIITTNPTGKFSARQDLTYGNYDQFRAKTHVELPRFGPFSASLTYLHSERRGDTRNLGAGTVFDYGPDRGGKLTSPKWLGSDNVEAFLGTIRADLVDGLDLVYKYDYSENHFTPNAIGDAYLPADLGFRAGRSVVRQLYDASTFPQTPISKTRPDAVNNWLNMPSFQKAQGHNFTATYNVSDAVKFKNILAYRKSQISNYFTLSGLGGLQNVRVDLSAVNPALGVNFPGLINGDPQLRSTLAGAPFSVLGNQQNNRDSQWSDEFQVNITTEWFNLTAGYLHFTSKSTNNLIPNGFNSFTNLVFAGQNTPTPNTAFVVPANAGFTGNTVRSTSDAWFAQPEFHITSQIDLIFGARITKDRKKGVETYPNQNIASALPQFVGQTRPFQTPIRYRDSEATYMANLTYKPTDDMLFYVKYADGYISGGQVATITFKPERAYSYEAGAKLDLFDRHFRSNLSVYHVDYKAVQFTTGGTLTGVPASALFGQAVVSSGDARANGIEWENTIVPLQGVTLGANVGYTDFKFDQNTIFGGTYTSGPLIGQNCFGPACATPNAAGVAPATGGFVAASGAPGYLPFARPKWTVNLSGQYETPEIFRSGRLLFRADGNFRSKSLMTSDVTRGSGITLQEDPALRAAATIPNTWVVNARAGIQGVEIGSATFDLVLWSKNLFNNKQLVQFTGVDLSTIGYLGSAIYERARTYGLDLTVRF